MVRITPVDPNMLTEKKCSVFFSEVQSTPFNLQAYNARCTTVFNPQYIYGHKQ